MQLPRRAEGIALTLGQAPSHSPYPLLFSSPYPDK